MTHLIEKQTIELRLKRADDAFELQQRMSAFCNNQLMPALENLFNRLAPAHKHIRLDELVIDLGKVSENKLMSNDFLDNILQQIERKIEAQILDNQAIVIQEQETNVFKMWLYFLENGRLPWFSHGLPPNFETDIPPILARSEAAILELRHLLMQQPNALNRLIRQHKTAFLALITGIFTASVQSELVEIDKALMYLMFDGVEYTELFLKAGYNLKLKMDAKQFDESIKYTGKGEAENNFLAQATIAESTFKYDDLLDADEANFNKMVDDKKSSDFQKLDSAKLNPNFVSLQKKNIEASLLGLRQYYNQKLEANKMNNLPSALFEYENQKGGRTKLEDLRGKYVYIDVWATWCGPCRGEIPFLQKVEEKYEGKNIAFVSISVDVEKDHDKWKTFVDDKKLGGIQLFADKNWKSDFIMAYGINSIPRFILIDPKGIIVKGDAARPSDPKLQKLLDSLLN